MKFGRILGKIFNGLGSSSSDENAEENLIDEDIKPKSKLPFYLIGGSGIFLLVVTLLVAVSQLQTLNIAESNMVKYYPEPENATALENATRESVNKRILTDTLKDSEDTKVKENIYYEALGALYRQYNGYDPLDTNFWNSSVTWWKELIFGNEVGRFKKTDSPFKGTNAIAIDTTLITSTLYANRFYTDMLNDDSISGFYDVNDQEFYDVHSTYFRDNVEMKYFNDAIDSSGISTRMTIDGIQILAKYMIRKESGYTTFYEDSSNGDKEDTTLHTKYKVSYATLGGCRAYVDMSEVEVEYVNSMIPKKIGGSYKWMNPALVDHQSLEGYLACKAQYGADDAQLNNMLSAYDTGTESGSVTYVRDCDGYKQYLLARTGSAEEGNLKPYPTQEDKEMSCGVDANGVPKCYQYTFIEAYYHGHVQRDENGIPGTGAIVDNIYSMMDFYQASTGIRNVCSPVFNEPVGDLGCGTMVGTGGCPYNDLTVDIYDLKDRIIKSGVSMQDYAIGVAIAEVGPDNLNEKWKHEQIKVQMLAAIPYGLNRSQYYNKVTGNVAKIYASTAQQVWCDPKENCYQGPSAVAPYVPNGRTYPQWYNETAADKYGISKAKVWKKALTDEQYKLYVDLYAEISSYVIIRKELNEYPSSFTEKDATGYYDTEQQRWASKAKNGMTFEQIIETEPYWKNNMKLFACAGYSPSYNPGTSGGVPTVYTDGARGNCLSPYKCYKQGDYTSTSSSVRYAATSGPGALSSTGCSPTSIAIIASGFQLKSKNGQVYTPETLVTEVIQGGGICSVKTACSYEWSYPLTFGKLGLNVERWSNLSNNSIKEKVFAHLRKGYPVYVHAKAGGAYTDGGHFMVLIGINDSNQVFLSDPGKRRQTSTNQGRVVNNWTTLDEMHKGGVDWGYLVSPK